ncbi:hypothetical protein PG994_014493 [Apiospora phragmitis]|uniref:Uncharacterized protein n=1 Tax=Apiospora phragmitis TaxID=2905665 RepID=A0ABR1T4G2_9PEZI
MKLRASRTGPLAGSPSEATAVSQTSEGGPAMDILGAVSDAPRTLDLELDMESALAQAYLGRYDLASSQLHGILGRINTLRAENPSDSTDEGSKHTLHPSNRYSAKALGRLKKSIETNNVDILESPSFKSMELSVMVTSAKITLLQGDYKAACADLHKTTEELKQHLGSESLKTIEALLYYAQSLVYTCNTEEAIEICENAMEVIETNFCACDVGAN